MLPFDWTRRVSRRAALAASVELAVASVALSACGATATVSTASQTSPALTTASAASTSARASTTAAASSAASATASSSVASTSSAASTATTTASASKASATAAASATVTPTVNPNALQVWDWGDTAIRTSWQQSLDALTAKNPKVMAAMINGGPFPTKFLTVAAAGTPPDVVFTPPEGGWPQSLGYKQLVRNLDGNIQTSKVQPADFFTPAWQGSLYQGHQYVMPLEVDPNFPMVYNKSLLQQVGIDAPPATISDLDDANHKLFQKNGADISRLGIIPPWLTYGSGNSLVTYFAMFGGSWFDPKDPTKLEMTQAGNVAALTWMKQYADQFGGYDALQKFNTTYGKSEYSGGQVAGAVAMSPQVSSIYSRILKLAQGTAYANSFALSLLPVAQGVKPNPGWLGGWAMAIPTGAKHPDDSWSVLQWLGDTPEGTDIWSEGNGFLPGYKKSPYFTKHANDPEVAGYITVLQGAYVVVPSPLGWTDIPGSAFTTLLQNIVQGKTEVNTALQQFQTVAQAALDKYKGT